LIDLSRARRVPYAHQLVGVESLVKMSDPPTGRTLRGCFMLQDEMRLGKSKQIIDAACVLFERGELDRVIIICPASVRAVWYDPDQAFGEISQHMWVGMPVKVTEYHARKRSWSRGTGHQLEWIVTNYDFIRNKQRREYLLKLCNAKTWLVLDESSAVKNHRAKQTKACVELRYRCGRVTLLNGTPISNSPGDMYSQGNIMDPMILQCKNYFHFRSRYGVIGGFQNREIVSWINIDDLQRRFKPYVLNRRMEDCFDLPEQLPPTYLTAALSDASWKIYKEMRDEMVAWLDQQTVAVAAQAGVKAMRLAQITSGFVGGLQEMKACRCREDESGDPEGLLPDPGCERCGGAGSFEVTGVEPREVGREKLDALLEWVDARVAEDPELKLLIWCRFRAEIARLYRVLTEERGFTQVGLIWGGQKRDERDQALRLLKPATSPKGVAIVIGTPASGAKGLDLSAAHHLVYCSNDYRLETRLQSEARIKHPSRKMPISYVDIIATGPAGQKTIDHAVLKALRAKNDLATWTVSAWITALKEE